MQNPILIVVFAVSLVLAAIILSMPIDEVEEVETYYTSEPLTYEKSLMREAQVPKWIFWDS